MNKKEQFAIEFAKFLFSSKVVKSRGPNDNKLYVPWEFELMLGELIEHPRKLIEDFKNVGLIDE